MSYEKEAQIHLGRIDEALGSIEQQERKIDELVQKKVLDIFAELLAKNNSPMSVEEFCRQNEQFQVSQKEVLFKKYLAYYEEKKRVLNALREFILSSDALAQ